MRRPPKIPGPKPAVEREMSEIGTVRKVRFGLGPKFTLPVSIAISLLIIFMGIVVSNSMSKALEREINENGIFAARLAASPEIDSWDGEYNTVEDLQARLARIDAAMAIAGGNVGNTGTPTSTEEERRLRELISAHDTAQRSFNKKRLVALLSQGALDVWIISEKGLKASATGKAKQEYRFDNEGFALSSSPETAITTGTYAVKAESATSEWEPARFFTHPIRNRESKSVGRATVVFSERALRSDLEAMRNRIIIFCIVGVIACGLVAFITSKVITRPLATLLKDIESVASGDLAHRTRVRSSDEIGSLAQTFDQMTQNLARAEEMRVDLAEKEHQVSIAQEVQERLFPRDLPHPEGLRLEARNRLAGELSADLFDVLLLRPGCVGILVMTASGRGIPAAIVLSMARSFFRGRCASIESPVEALKAINALLSPDLRRGMYVSALYAIVDTANGRCTLASAGHRVPVLQFVAASSGLKKLLASGIAMGLDKGPIFDRSLSETVADLAHGDRLVVASEGAFTLNDASGASLGEDAFAKIVLAACKKNASAEALMEAIMTRTGKETPERDISIVQATRT